MPEENPKPLDLRSLRDSVKRERDRLKLRFFPSEGESSFTLALALSAAMKKILFGRSETTFSSEPVLEKKMITQFLNRMRIDAMEKFNSTTVFSVLQFSANEEGMRRQEYILTVIVYLEQKYLPEFLRLLQYPYIDSDDEIEVRDGCGTLANLIAGQYKKEMANLGYKDLTMSTFQSYINTCPDGVGIPKGLTEKYELSFDVDGIKRLVIEMVTIDMLPQWQTREKMVPKRILIVDDDVMFIRIMEPFLRLQGFEVIVAHNGEEGIKRLKVRPHLIILDMLMPVMDGPKFVQEKKKIEGELHVPLIVITARENLTDKFKIEGASEYLFKPFQPATLLKSIQRYI